MLVCLGLAKVHQAAFNMIYSRRQVLQIASACASTLWLPRSAWSQVKFSENPFTLGVASGAPTVDSVVVWTRLAISGLFGSGIGKDPVTVRWEIADDDQFKNLKRSGQSQAVAELAHSVHVEVPNLEPDRWYFYRFMVGDAVSAVGRTRTLPRPDAIVNRLRLAYASCQRYEHGYFSAYKHMIKEDLDFVLFLGDYIYEYPQEKDGIRVPTGGWVVSLDDYRQRYALHKREPELQAMHAACPWLLTWDDHEVQNDYAGVSIGENGPAVSDFLARRANAYQAYYEHMPLRASTLTRAISGLATGADMRLYQSLQFGRLASLHLLDQRQYRSPQACTRDGRAGSGNVDPAKCPLWLDPSRTLLGTEQEAWLDQTLSRSQAPWNVVGQSTLFGQRDYKIGAGQTLWNDGWDGYTPARDRALVSMQKNKASMPVLLGGDVHANWVGHIKADYNAHASANVGVEFCGTSITARGGNGKTIPERLAENPHFVFANEERRGYGVVQFTPTLLTTHLRVIDDPTKRETQIETLAKFEVQAGRADIQNV